MTKLEEFLLSRMTVRRWLLTLLLALTVGVAAGWYVGRRKPEPLPFASAEARTTHPPKTAANFPTIAGFNNFLAKFVPQMKAQIEAIHNAPHPSSRDRSYDRERQSVEADLVHKVDCTLFSADLKKTDSVVNPIVGVALVKLTDSTTSKTINFMNTTTYIYTITFASNDDGKWQAIRAVVKTTNIIAFPEDPRQMRNIGNDVDMPLDWISTAAVDAQK